PGIAATSGATAVGAYRSTSNFGEIRYLTYDAAGWNSPVPIVANETSSVGVSMASLAGAGELVFRGDNGKHYFALHGASWSPTAEPITFGGVQSSGPTAPSLTALGVDTIIAFAGDDGNLYDQKRSVGAWAAANLHAIAGSGGIVFAPTIVALGTSPDLLVAY